MPHFNYMNYKSGASLELPEPDASLYKRNLCVTA